MEGLNVRQWCAHPCLPSGEANLKPGAPFSPLNEEAFYV